ncbi:MAG: DUF1993 domain-containing protein [Sphingobium sp.]|nr:MAG: DUF1993 domain-containing protein [Sphingobium sp.]
MPLSLHAATVPSYIQIVGAVAALVDKAEAHCTAHGWPAARVIDAQLAPDMRSFAYQVKSVAVHSIGAIEGVRRGSFSPDNTTPPDSFEGLRARMAETRAALEALTEAELAAFEGQPMAFAFGEHRIPFTAVNFLLSFSQPNFYFHATTAYDILRSLGVPLGKRDFLGQQRRG